MEAVDESAKGSRFGAVLILLALLGEAQAEDPGPDPGPDPAARLREAQATVARGEHASALLLYDAVLKEVDVARAVRADAALCAWVAGRARKALVYADWALEGADDAFRESARGAELLALRPKMEEAVERHLRESRERFARFLEATIRDLHRHRAVTRSKILARRGDEEKWDLEDGLWEDGFFGMVSSGGDDSHVDVVLTERYPDETTARERFEAVVALVRARKEHWEKRHASRSRRYRPELTEVRWPPPDEERPREILTWAWEAGDRSSAARSEMARVDLMGPDPAAEEPGGRERILLAADHLPHRWSVMTTLTSRWLK